MENLFTSHDLKVTDRQSEKFAQLFHLFSEWNQKINLSAIREKTEVYEKHFVDSLLSTKYVDFNGKNILDLGAGGGFPILPLAIVSQRSPFTALDSVGKKMKAVQDMADTLNLPVKTFHGRIETFGQDRNFREKFDIVTARALAPWPVLLEYALPFVRIGGQFVAYQGPAILEDLKKYKNIETILGGKMAEVFEDQLGAANRRIFVVIKKMKACPRKYPRPVGEPKSCPIAPPTRGY